MTPPAMSDNDRERHHRPETSDGIIDQPTGIDRREHIARGAMESTHEGLNPLRGDRKQDTADQQAAIGFVDEGSHAPHCPTHMSVAEYRAMMHLAHKIDQADPIANLAALMVALAATGVIAALVYGIRWLT